MSLSSSGSTVSFKRRGIVAQDSACCFGDDVSATLR